MAGDAAGAADATAGGVIGAVAASLAIGAAATSAILPSRSVSFGAGSIHPAATSSSGAARPRTSATVTPSLPSPAHSDQMRASCVS